MGWNGLDQEAQPLICFGLPRGTHPPGTYPCQRSEVKGESLAPSSSCTGFLRFEGNLLENIGKMNSDGYVVEVTSLSPKATEKDVFDFFAFSGVIQHVEIVRSGNDACTAYVTFKDAYSQETACLLSGATILDQHVCITRWGQNRDEHDFWSRPSYGDADETTSTQPQSSHFVSSAGEAVTVAQDVVKTMLAKGYVLGKDALANAKAFDESHQVSATASAKVAELNQRIGLTEKISAGVNAVRSVDQRYHVSETAMSAASATGRSVAAAANSVVNSGYFAKGATWVSGVLSRAADAAADLGSRADGGGRQ